MGGFLTTKNFTPSGIKCKFIEKRTSPLLFMALPLPIVFNLPHGISSLHEKTAKFEDFLCLYSVTQKNAHASAAKFEWWSRCIHNIAPSFCNIFHLMSENWVSLDERKRIKTFLGNFYHRKNVLVIFEVVTFESKSPSDCKKRAGEETEVLSNICCFKCGGTRNNYKSCRNVL